MFAIMFFTATNKISIILLLFIIDVLFYISYNSCSNTPPNGLFLRIRYKIMENPKITGGFTSQVNFLKFGDLK